VGWPFKKRFFLNPEPFDYSSDALTITTTSLCCM